MTSGGKDSGIRAEKNSFCWRYQMAQSIDHIKNYDYYYALCRLIILRRAKVIFFSSNTTVRGSLVSACEAGMKRTYFRERECRTWAAGTWEAVEIGNGAGKTG